MRTHSSSPARGAVARTAGRAVLLVLPALAWAAAALVAQEIPARLSLDEAIRLARENNPGFQSQRNDIGAADWQVREAYGSFLPTVGANGSLSYTEAGVQRIGTLDFGAQSTDWYSSSYNLGLSWTLDGNTLFGVPNARAARRATAAGIDAAAFDLESAVTLQYMAALRARDGVEVARRQRDRAKQNLEIVETRVESGAAAGVEGKQAEVDLGRAEVALIEAEQNLGNQKLRLMEQIGLPMEEAVALEGGFEIFQPGWTRRELVSYALEAHPALVSARAQESAQKASVRQARSEYFPSVTFSTSFRGNTLQALNEDFLISSEARTAELQAEGCQRLKMIQSGLGNTLPGVPDSCPSPTLSASERQDILAGNDVFPFDFTKQPVSLSMTVSVPIFTGFTRQRSLEQAEAASRDAVHARRADELRLRRAVTEAYNALMAAHQVVGIEARNRELADERLEAARQRYAMGAAPSGGAASAGSTFLELLDAQTSMSTAERDYLDAVYDFHLSLAQLEAATGQTLRPASGGPDGQGAS